MDLKKILEDLTKGKINSETAQDLIQSLQKKTEKVREDIQQDGFKKTMMDMAKHVKVDEILKTSTDAMQYFVDKVPEKFEKIKENMVSDNSLQNLRGIQSSFCVFRFVECSLDSSLSQNVIVGSQWMSVAIQNSSDVQKNKWTGVQIQDWKLDHSDFCGNVFALIKMSNNSILSSRMDENRLTRSTLLSCVIDTSDFLQNKIWRSVFTECTLRASRLVQMTFSDSVLERVEFENCNIEGLHAQKLLLTDCKFSNVHVVFPEGFQWENMTISQGLIENISTPEGFLKALEDLKKKNDDMKKQECSSENTINQKEEKNQENTEKQEDYKTQRRIQRSTPSEEARNFHNKNNSPLKGSSKSTEKEEKYSRKYTNANKTRHFKSSK